MGGLHQKWVLAVVCLKPQYEKPRLLTFLGNKSEWRHTHSTSAWEPLWRGRHSIGFAEGHMLAPDFTTMARQQGFIGGSKLGSSKSPKPYFSHRNTPILEMKPYPTNCISWRALGSALWLSVWYDHDKSCQQWPYYWCWFEDQIQMQNWDFKNLISSWSTIWKGWNEAWQRLYWSDH